MNDAGQDVIPLGATVTCSPEEWMADLKRFVKLKDFQSIAMVLIAMLHMMSLKCISQILEQIREANLNGNEVSPLLLLAVIVPCLNLL